MLATPSPPDLVLPILDWRLAKTSAAPIVLALSGGGDSVALLHIAAGWAGRNGRRLIALHVDHQINPASADWAMATAGAAERAGASFRALVWTGPKPSAGLSAAARTARHALLAQAARDAGAKVVLMGHTADDVLEAAVMRAGGSTVGAPREWAPSPAWPEGRGVFLLRPMLGVRRAALRDYLGGLGETWIDDPSNTDPRFARSRARAAVGEQAVDQPTEIPAGPLIWRDLSGALIAWRSDVRTAPARDIAAACLCAAGGVRPPRGAALARLVEQLRGEAAFTATLAGARIEADEREVHIMREAGEYRRKGRPSLFLQPGQSKVWDGRFEVFANQPSEVQPLAGLAGRLRPAERVALSRLPPALRPSLPVVVDEAGKVTCPILAEGGPVRLGSLALERFTAFCGHIGAES